MMRIKEAIQRRKLIHEMNEEVKDIDLEVINYSSSPIPYLPFQECRTEEQPESSATSDNALQSFVQYLSGKMTDCQKRALKVTWKRLSEAPKTSGRGTIHIMEKVLTKLCESEPLIPAIFYRSAFLSCIEDRRCRRTRGSSIATIRDHAHILVEYVDAIIRTMFDGASSTEKAFLCPEGIGPTSHITRCDLSTDSAFLPRDGLPVRYPNEMDDVKDATVPEESKSGMAHARLGPLGFERRMWHVLGECFAEVMFNQECIRAFPHAPSAWSLLSIAMTDKMYAAGKPFSINVMQQPQRSWTTPSVNKCPTDGDRSSPHSSGVMKPSLSSSLVESRRGNFSSAREHLAELSNASFRKGSDCSSTLRHDVASSAKDSPVKHGEATSKASRATPKEKWKKMLRSKSESRFVRCSPRTSFV